MVKYLIEMDNNKIKYYHTKYLPKLKENNMIYNYNTNYNQRNNNIFDSYNKNQRFILNRSTKISNNSNNNLNNVIKISNINQKDLGYNIRNNSILRRFNNKNNYSKYNSNEIIHPETYFENFFKNNSDNNLPRSNNNSLKKFNNFNSNQNKKLLNSSIQNTKKSDNILPYMVNNNVHFNEINNIGYKTVNENEYFPNQNIPLNKTYANTPEKSKTNFFRQENKNKNKYNFNYTTSTQNKKGFQKYKINYPHIKKKICPLCKKEIDSYKYTFHINLHPSLIFPGIFLGAYRNACHKEEIKNLEINYVLNCAMECYDNFNSNIKYLHLKLNDLPSFNIRPFLDKAADFINECKENNGCILIHCQMGISRSTSCLIAYMIKYLGYSFMEALEYIKKRRPQVFPNYGFIKHLMNYEKINKK